MKIYPIKKLYAALLSAALAASAGAAENTYYIWAGATAHYGEPNPLNSENWSTSNTEYVAPPEGTEMNSPDANWVFDYGAYLPISGRQDNIYYRIETSTLRLNSISIINHDATTTGYWDTNGFHETGGNTGIKIVSNKSDSNWNIGTFTYTGAAGSDDRGVNFGAANRDSSQAIITVGEMNIGYGENRTSFSIGPDAAGTAYATVESGNVKVGDPVGLSDSSGPKSLTITGDFNIHGNTTVNMNVYDNDASAVHSEASPDMVVGGVVRMTQNESGTSPTWNLLYRASTVSWATGNPKVPATNTYIKIGGLEGTGTVTNNSRTLEASTVKLIFANETDCEFTGGFTENRSDTIKTVMSVKMAGRDGVKQIIHADAKFTGTVEVESGTLIMNSTTALGKLTMTGGAFGGIDGGIIVSSAEWRGGDFIFYSADAMNGGGDMVRIEGTFAKAGEGKIGIDFAGFDPSVFIEDGTVLELITAQALEGFSSDTDADEDFLAKNLANGFADFEWVGNTLTVSFSAVPEPAALAAIIGAAALAIAAIRRKK